MLFFKCYTIRWLNYLIPTMLMYYIMILNEKVLHGSRIQASIVNRQLNIT